MEHGQQEVQPSIHWAELGESCQKICLREIPFKDLMESTKGWNPTRKINQVVTPKGKLPKSADTRFVQGKVKDLGFQRNQPEDREGLSRTRRPGRRHLGCSGGWQNNEADNINPAIHTPIQQEPETRGLKGYRSNDLSQRDRLQGPHGNHQRLESYQAVQTPGGKGTQDKGESSASPSYRRTVNPERAYSDSFRLTRSRPNQLPSGFTPFRNKQVSDQESPFFKILGGFQGETRIQGEKLDLFQSKEERVRPNDPEVVGFGEKSEQEPEVVVNHSRIRSPINRNITPTLIEHNAVSPE
ncbi:hypothetical protein O181_109169 [Austropuccinia psidii MF-1]|uniref:Uncharacterized protein n=1 Tax=Austropuccinia psidii MF-1 TaxID=1389203 RepID=A0A9Q3JXJ5_9BASI|nr:hypothetical protein [Austropuccinia psidii MF-1]